MTGMATSGREAATRPVQRWAYDFVFDTCADGRTLKVLDGDDEFTRGCLAIDVAGGIRSGRVIEVLAQLVSVHGAALCAHWTRTAWAQRPA